LPQDLAFGPDGNLYVSNSTGFISRFDGSTGAARGEFSTDGLDGPNGLTFGPDGNLYVSGAFSRNVVRYNPLTGAVIDEFVSQGLEIPTDLTFGPDGNLYINSQFPATPSNIGGILRYDGQDGTFIDQFVTPGSGGLGLVTRGFLFVGKCCLIDIQPNRINLCAKGPLSVAIISFGPFDFAPTEVDPAEVQLEGAGVKTVGKDDQFLVQTRDVNGDGLPDLILKIAREGLGLSSGDTVAELTGETFGGTLFKAKGAVEVEERMCIRTLD
jgi:hypothetical protein